jgi:hypothetical protein
MLHDIYTNRYNMAIRNVVAPLVADFLSAELFFVGEAAVGGMEVAPVVSAD